MLLDKIDLVTQDELLSLELRLTLKDINKTPSILECTNSKLPPDQILGLNSFNMESILNMGPGVLVWVTQGTTDHMAVYIGDVGKPDTDDDEEYVSIKWTTTNMIDYVPYSSVRQRRIVPYAPPARAAAAPSPQPLPTTTNIEEDEGESKMASNQNHVPLLLDGSSDGRKGSRELLSDTPHQLVPDFGEFDQVHAVEGFCIPLPGDDEFENNKWIPLEDDDDDSNGNISNNNNGNASASTNPIDKSSSSSGNNNNNILQQYYNRALRIISHCCCCKYPDAGWSY